MIFGKRERLIGRILVVEDEPLVAFDNEHMLSDAGYEVVATVDNVADAATVIEEQELDLVLTDIRLAGDGDGTEVARLAGSRKVPVLFVSANCPPEASALGVGCLAKPYTSRDLRQALEAVDELLQGNEVKKLPPGLSLFEKA